MYAITRALFVGVFLLDEVSIGYRILLGTEASNCSGIFSEQLAAHGEKGKKHLAVYTEKRNKKKDKMWIKICLS